MKDFLDKSLHFIDILKQIRKAHELHADNNQAPPASNTDIPHCSVSQDARDPDSDPANSSCSPSPALPPDLDPNVEASFDDYIFDSEETLSDDLSNQKRRSGKANGVYVNEDGQLVEEWDANIDGSKSDNDDDSDNEDESLDL